MQDGGMEVAVELDMSLGESPVWSVARQTLYWTDINNGHIYAWRSQHDGTPTRTELGEKVGCVSLTGSGLVAAAASGILRLPEGGEPERLADNPEWQEGRQTRQGNRFNDGRCDAKGRLWVGTIDADEVSPSGALYCVTGKQLVKKKADIVISNGLAFSPDSRWLYHTDSLTRRVVRHRFDVENGTIGEPEPWIDLAEHDLPGVPDGAAVDSEGNYWCALYDGGRIAKFSHDGRWIESYAVPCPHPTMVAFGGSDLCTLFITTATQHLDEAGKRRWPLAGSVFALATSSQGLEEPTFIG